MHNTDNTDKCCPVFDPEHWESKTHKWENKNFIMETIPQLFHIPVPSYFGRAVTRMWELALAENASPDLKDFLLMAYDPSPWKSELYMAVNREVPGAKNIKLSGTYLSKVFDGPYNRIPQYIKEVDKYLEGIGKKAVKYYFYFTTCPECARKYGHNYIVAITEIT